ncbi:hypothetical protein CR513_49191, partial [Mucuna pruriens]
MDTEMEALEKNKTWELVSLPKGKKLVVKCKADGSIERYKARLVTKGFTQTYGIDYSKTFALVAKMDTIWVISLAAKYDWELQQFDVKNAFLHGELEEEYEVAVNFVCRLKKALYGLKQSPWAWFRRFTKVMTTLGICLWHAYALPMFQAKGFQVSSNEDPSIANVGVPGSLVTVSAPRVPIVRKPSKSSEIIADRRCKYRVKKGVDGQVEDQPSIFIIIILSRPMPTELKALTIEINAVPESSTSRLESDGSHNFPGENCSKAQAK